MGVREQQALAASLSAGIRHAYIPVVLRILDETRPPPKRFRKRFARRVSRTEGYAQINASAYFEIERVAQHISHYNVRNRLPAVLAAYSLVTSQNIPISRLFHNGLLSDHAVSAILSSVIEHEETTQSPQAKAASKQQSTGQMKSPTTGTATSHFIAGVNLPIIDAEPDVVVAFNKFRAVAIKEAEAEIDQTDEIEVLLGKGKALLRTLEH